MQRLLHLIYSYFLAFVQHFHFIEFVGLDNAHSNQMWSIIFCLENFFIVICFSSLRKECFEQVFNQIKNALRYNCRHHKVSMYIVAPQVVILYFLLIQKYTHTLSRQLSTRTTNRVQAVFEIIAQELSDCLKWNWLYLTYNLINTWWFRQIPAILPMPDSTIG